MNTRIPIKTSFETVSGVLLTLGCLGLYLGIQGGNVTAGMFGIAGIMLAITVRAFRHVWNEDWWKKNNGGK